MVKPSCRRKVAQILVAERGLSIRLTCRILSVSETCYRYQAKLSDENAKIADWLIRLTQWQRNWGFGLCFLYLRNVKGYGWNHKRVYRIYRELELNMRIKPRKRLVREKPEPLAVPVGINQTWSMDFMHDQLADGRSYRLFNVLMTTIVKALVLKSTCHCLHHVLHAPWIRLSSGEVNLGLFVATTGQNTSVNH